DELKKKNKDTASLENIYKEFPSQELIDTGDFYDCRIMPDCLNEEDGLAKEYSIIPPDSSQKKRCKLDIAFSCMIKPADAVTQKDHYRFVFVCENKIDSKEGNDQTVTYANWVQEGCCFPIFSKGDQISGSRQSKLHTQGVTHVASAQCFLTVRSNDKPQDRSFVMITYADLMNDVLMPCFQHEKLSAIGKSLLAEYIHTLDRCGFALSDIMKKYARNIAEKHTQTIFAMLKVQLFNDKFYNTSCDDKKLVAIKLDWIARVLKANEKYQITTKGKEANVLPGKKFGVPEVFQFDKNGNRINKHYATKEIRINDKALAEYWTEYEKKVYPPDKLSYTWKVGEKYKNILRILFHYLRDYTSADDPYYKNWPRGDYKGKNVNCEYVFSQFMTMGNAFYNDSKTWIDWSKYAEKIYKYTRIADRNADDEGKYVVTYIDLDDGKTGKAKVLLIKRPCFYAVEDDPNTLLVDSVYNGTNAVKCYIPSNTLPWSQCCYVKNEKGIKKYFIDFADQ
ncbi:MAG: hypothetical protein J6S98_10600, partial [Lentisphaeria bacterium]|nr:hypothetical protein [Lentisphaeria bacterium]